MPKVQHPAFREITLDIDESDLKVHLEAGWLLVVTGSPTGGHRRGSTTVTHKGATL